MAVEYVDKNNDDGTNFGHSGGKIGFLGLTTPIVQQTLTSTATTASATLCYNGVNYGFASQNQADHVITLLNQIQAVLIAFGLAAEG